MFSAFDYQLKMGSHYNRLKWHHPQLFPFYILLALTHKHLFWLKNKLTRVLSTVVKSGRKYNPIEIDYARKLKTRKNQKEPFLERVFWLQNPFMPWMSMLQKWIRNKNKSKKKKKYTEIMISNENVRLMNFPFKVSRLKTFPIYSRSKTNKEKYVGCMILPKVSLSFYQQWK